MVGRFELSARPCCVSIDACWSDAAAPAPVSSTDVLSDTDETGGTGAASFEDLELADPPSTGDLAESRFLVVAGYGAGNREGAERSRRRPGAMGRRLRRDAAPWP